MKPPKTKKTIKNKAGVEMVYTTVVIPAEIWVKIVELAAADDRTETAYLRRIVTDAVNTRYRK